MALPYPNKEEEGGTLMMRTDEMLAEIKRRGRCNDCEDGCQCVGKCFGCGIKEIICPLFVCLVASIAVILAAVALGKYVGLDMDYAISTAISTVKSSVLSSSSDPMAVFSSRHRIRSYTPSSPSQPAPVPSAIGWVDWSADPLRYNVTWIGIPVSELGAIGWVTRSATSGAGNPYYNLPFLTPGYHEVPCGSSPNMCTALASAWTNGDGVFLGLFHDPPPMPALSSGLLYASVYT